MMDYDYLLGRLNTLKAWAKFLTDLGERYPDLKLTFNSKADLSGDYAERRLREALWGAAHDILSVEFGIRTALLNDRRQRHKSGGD